MRCPVALLSVAVTLALAGTTLAQGGMAPVTPATAPATAPAAETTPAAPAMPAEARAVLDRAIKAYQDANAYADMLIFKVDMKMKMGEEDNSNTQEQKSRLLWAKEGKRFVVSSDEFLLSSDGKLTTAYIEPFKQYIQRELKSGESPADVAGPLMMAVQAHPVANLLIGGTDTEPFAAIKTVEKVDRVEKDGKKQIILVGRGPSGILPTEDLVPVTMTFDEATGLLVQMTSDSTEAYRKYIDSMLAQMPAEMRAAAPKPVVDRMMLEISLLNTQVNQAVADDAFAFKAPEGVKKVDEFSMGGDQGSGEADQQALVGKPSPAFEGKLLDGSAFKLADAKGKVVVMDFWATWCGPCVKAIPYIQAMWEEFSKSHPDQILFLGMNHDGKDDDQKIAQFIEKNKVTFKQFDDRENAVGEQFKVNGIPCMVIIDREGVVQHIHTGFAPGMEKDLKEKISAVLAGKPAAAPAGEAEKK